VSSVWSSYSSTAFKMGRLILFTFLIFTTLLTCSRGHYEKWKEAGPSVKQSWGEPWPKPQRSINYGENFMIVRPYMFQIEVRDFEAFVGF
jgi:hypothetical protein